MSYLGMQWSYILNSKLYFYQKDYFMGYQPLYIYIYIVPLAMGIYIYIYIYPPAMGIYMYIYIYIYP